MGIYISNTSVLEELVSEFDGLSFQDDVQLDYLIRKTRMVIENLFGPSSKYLTEINSVLFYPYQKQAPLQIKKEHWQNGIKEMKNICRIMNDELSIFYSQTITPKLKKNPAIFIVHGHDVEVRESVARLLFMLNLGPKILGEQPNFGDTIIEKFEKNSDVGAAIILFTPDDLGVSANENLDNLKPRARQNVVLELGFFLGALERKKIILIHKKMEDFVIPSDILGMVHIEFDDKGGWKWSLVQELVGLGFDIDITKLGENN